MLRVTKIKSARTAKVMAKVDPRHPKKQHIIPSTIMVKPTIKLIYDVYRAMELYFRAALFAQYFTFALIRKVICGRIFMR